MAQSVYIETTIPSYLAARPSRDLLQAARQQLTHDWWNTQKGKFELCISQIVIDESAAGDKVSAQARLAFLEGLPLLELTDDVARVSARIIGTGIIPQQAARDAIHIAASTVNGIDYLLTWNCRHIANAAIIKQLTLLMSAEGMQLPVICTPEELYI